MEKGKALARRWALEFTESSALSSSSSSGIPDPLGYNISLQDLDDSTVARQKKDAEAAWDKKYLS